MSGGGFQAQVSAILEVLAGAAAAEICKLVEESSAGLRLENRKLRDRMRVMERALQNRERESPAGYSQLKRPAVSSRTDHSSTDQHGEPPGRVNSVKYESADLDSEPEVLIVKEEVVQEVCDGSPCGVKWSLRADPYRLQRARSADYPSEDPNTQTSSEQGKAALSAESVVQMDVFVNAVDLIEQGVAQTPDVHVDMKTASEGSGTGSCFHQQHFDFLSVQESSSRSEVNSDFLPVESGAVEEELDGLGAVLRRGSGESVQQETGASEQWNSVVFVDSLSGASLDHVSWICDPEVHPNQTLGIPHNPRGVCAKSFSHLRQHHERVHGEERVYRCGRCGRQFPQLCRLKRHERVHTGEKPFRCSKCGKHFSQANNLKVHQSVHTGERRFSCAQCGKNFSFLSNLIRHKALHAGK